VTRSPLEMWGFSTPQMTAVFSAESLVGAMLQFERELVLALADARVAPQEEAEAAAAACESPVADPESLLDTTWTAGTPVIALVDEIRSRLDNDDQRSWIHFGSTTQDVVDTAHMLLSGRALAELIRSLERIATEMRDIAEAHRDTPQIGRTFLQHAQPKSFGLRVVGWLDPTLGHIEGLRTMTARLPLQLGGPVGDRARYGSRGEEVARALAYRLGLQSTDLSWHSDRSIVRQVAAAVADATSTMAKVAGDVALLAQSDTAEVEVRSGGSSAMSGKRNPIDAIRALAASEVALGMASALERSRPIELDRGLGSWHAEWALIPSMFQAASGCFDAVESLLGSLAVDAGAMAGRAGSHAPEHLASIDPRQFEAVMDRYESIVETR
jgi:3-carboxy-cis,cis-muconate cycloisomerase